MRAAMILVVGLGLTTAGCASEIEPAPGTYTGGDATGSTELGPLEAPVLESVIPMAKVLRVRWSVSSQCDVIDGERRTDTMTFIPVFSTIGTDTDYVDEEANEDQSYTYRVRCIRGEDASEYSNMLGANPFIQ